MHNFSYLTACVINSYTVYATSYTNRWAVWIKFNLKTNTFSAYIVRTLSQKYFIFSEGLAVEMMKSVRSSNLLEFVSEIIFHQYYYNESRITSDEGLAEKSCFSASTYTTNIFFEYKKLSVLF